MKYLLLLLPFAFFACKKDATTPPPQSSTSNLTVNHLIPLAGTWDWVKANDCDSMNFFPAIDTFMVIDTLGGGAVNYFNLTPCTWSATDSTLFCSESFYQFPANQVIPYRWSGDTLVLDVVHFCPAGSAYTTHEYYYLKF